MRLNYLGRATFVVAAVVISTGWTACGGNMNNTVCAPDQLVGKQAAAVSACYGAPSSIAKCARPGCISQTEERWFYSAVWAERSVDAPPFACVVVVDGVVTHFINDSMICEIGSPGPASPP